MAFIMFNVSAQESFMTPGPQQYMDSKSKG